MREYRITKYDPNNRIGGMYSIDEWTSISDIGKTFNNIQLTYEVYQKTEKSYIDCCIEIMKAASINQLILEHIEYYENNLYFPTYVSDIEEIRRIIASCLREKCWLKLTAKDFFIHFGYDYNLYVGSALPTIRVNEIASKYGLYCEFYQSPY